MMEATGLLERWKQNNNEHRNETEDMALVHRTYLAIPIISLGFPSPRHSGIYQRDASTFK